MSLVLCRKVDEEIVFGDPKNPIGVMKITAITGGKVSLAFDFSKSITIHRREIAEKVRGFPLPSFGHVAP